MANAQTRVRAAQPLLARRTDHQHVYRVAGPRSIFLDVHQTLDEEDQPVTEYVRYNLTTDDRLRVSLTRIVNSAGRRTTSLSVKFRSVPGSFGKRNVPLRPVLARRTGYLKAFERAAGVNSRRYPTLTRLLPQYPRSGRPKTRLEIRQLIRETPQVPGETSTRGVIDPFLSVLRPRCARGMRDLTRSRERTSGQIIGRLECSVRGVPASTEKDNAGHTDHGRRARCLLRAPREEAKVLQRPLALDGSPQ